MKTNVKLKPRVVIGFNCGTKVFKDKTKYNRKKLEKISY